MQTSKVLKKRVKLTDWTAKQVKLEPLPPPRGRGDAVNNRPGAGGTSCQPSGSQRATWSWRQMFGGGGEDGRQENGREAQLIHVESIRQGYHVKPETRNQYLRCNAKLLVHWVKEDQPIVSDEFKETLNAKLAELGTNMTQEKEAIGAVADLLPDTDGEQKVPPLRWEQVSEDDMEDTGEAVRGYTEELEHNARSPVHPAVVVHLEGHRHDKEEARRGNIIPKEDEAGTSDVRACGTCMTNWHCPAAAGALKLLSLCELRDVSKDVWATWTSPADDVVRPPKK